MRYIKEFLKSPIEVIIGNSMSNKQDIIHSKDEVYLSGRGELILNLNNPQVQRKLKNQIKDFAKVELI